MQGNRRGNKPNQSTNCNNHNIDYMEMLRGLRRLCKDGELVLCLDNNAKINHIKEPAHSQLSNNVKKMIGRYLWDVLPPALVEKRKAIFSRVLKLREVERYESEQDGQWLEVMVTPMFDKQRDVNQVLILMRDITRNKQIEKEILRSNDQLEQLVAQRTAELENKAKIIEDLNTALSVLLQKRDEEKKERHQYMLSAINQFIIPHVREIQRHCTDQRILSCMTIIETNVNHFIETFHQSMQSQNYKLTPTEIEVVLLIKSGKASKDIAQILSISSETVETHRKNIRHKLGLQHKKENLQSYLASLGM